MIRTIARITISRGEGRGAALGVIRLRPASGSEDKLRAMLHEKLDPEKLEGVVSMHLIESDPSLSKPLTEDPPISDPGAGDWFVERVTQRIDQMIQRAGHTGFGINLGAIGDDSLVIEAYVDANGRVQDYRILSDPDKLQDLPHQIKNMLIFTTFRPATWMGSPRPGTAVLSFSKISVKG